MHTDCSILCKRLIALCKEEKKLVYISADNINPFVVASGNYYFNQSTEITDEDNAIGDVWDKTRDKMLNLEVNVYHFVS